MVDIIPESVTYSKYPVYDITPYCANCKYWDGEKSEWGYCRNSDIPAYIQGGLTQPVKFCFSCPLHELRGETWQKT